MNCKQGDLARVVGYPDVAHCIVHVDKLLSASECIEEGISQPAWSCTALCRMPDMSGAIAGPGEEILIADRCLRPLPPDTHGYGVSFEAVKQRRDDTLVPKRQVENSR